MKKLILASIYYKKINCILPYLNKLNMTSIDKIVNLPRYGHFCGIDVYQFVAEMNKVYEEKLLEEVTKEVTKENEEE